MLKLVVKNADVLYRTAAKRKFFASVNKELLKQP